MNLKSSQSKEKEEINFLAQLEEEKELLTHYQLYKALLWIDDILERATIKWVLVGDLADQLHKQNDPTLSSDRIEIEILRKHFTETGRSTMGSFIVGANDENLTELNVDYESVPISIKIIDKDPGYLENPDTRFYYVSEFRIPNPYEVYKNGRNN